MIVLRIVICIVLTKYSLAEYFKLSVAHINDFHVRFEETGANGGICRVNSKCIGGFSRLYKQLTSMKTENADLVLLNAGDDFVGTAWYTVGKWNVTKEFMSKIPFDAQVLGNHEFDDGIEGLIPFITGLNYPFLMSNMNDSMEKNFQNLISKSAVIERNGRKIGIIGVVKSDFDALTGTGNLSFYPESQSVNAEAERLVSEEGVYTNIILSHSGYDVDKAIAANASEKISLIVGAHTHTFLYSGDNPPGSEPVGDAYPTVIESKFGHQVLVTQAGSFARFIGNITVFLDENGEVANYSGGPIYLDSDFPQDEEINQLLLPWKNRVDTENVLLGSTMVTLSMEKCQHAECTLGNFVTDAMVYAYSDVNENGNAWTYASIAVINHGGLLNNLAVGDIHYNDLISALPYKDTFDVGEIKGEDLKEIFERNTTTSKLLQVSGIKIVYNFSLPEGKQVQSLKIRCQNCSIPRYEEINLNQTYRLVVSSYLAAGPQQYPLFPKKLSSILRGRTNTDVLRDYLSTQSPIFQEEGGRIVIHTDDGNNEEDSNNPGGNNSSTGVVISFYIQLLLIFCNLI